GGANARRREAGLLQAARRNTRSLARDLADVPRDRAGQAQRGGGPHRPFAPDERGLHLGAVGEGASLGNRTAVEEVDEADYVAGLEQDFAGVEVNPLDVRSQQRQVWAKRLKDLV